MLMHHNRFQEEPEQPQVQAEWTLVDGQLVCQWQPLLASTENMDQPLSMPKRQKAA